MVFQRFFGCSKQPTPNIANRQHIKIVNLFYTNPAPKHPRNKQCQIDNLLFHTFRCLIYPRYPRRAI